VSLALPEPILDPLRNSPLRLVVCQVRFEEILSVTDARVGLNAYELVGGRQGPYPIFEQFKGEQLDVRVTPGAPVVATQTPVAGWRMRSADQAWTIVLLPGSVALETTAYTTWDADFGPRLDTVIDAAAGALKPALQLRLGLRYVDVVTRPGIEHPDQWRGWIADSLLGPILHPVLGAGVLTTQQQVDLGAGDGIRCTLRHGSIVESPGGGLAYLLDWDVYDDAAREFDSAALKESVRRFNRLAVQLFQQAITPALFDELRG